MDKWPTIEDIFTFDLPIYVVADADGKPICRLAGPGGQRLPLFTDADLATRFLGFLTSQPNVGPCRVWSVESAEALICLLEGVTVPHAEFDCEPGHPDRRSFVWPLPLLLGWVRHKFGR